MIKLFISFIILASSYLNANSLQEANRLYIQGDFKNAMIIFKRLAKEDDNVESMYNIANMYYIGQGVLKDYTIAYDWYEMAADEGDALAMYNISLLYERGEGVEIDPGESFYWCEKSAKAGLPLAMYKLGLMNIMGYGASKDMSDAKFWINKAYENGISQAKITWEQNKLWEY